MNTQAIQWIRKYYKKTSIRDREILDPQHGKIVT